MYLFGTPVFCVISANLVSYHNIFVSIPPLRKLLKPFGDQALRPDFISFLGVLNNYTYFCLFLQNHYMFLLYRRKRPGSFSAGPLSALARLYVSSYQEYLLIDRISE